MRILRAGTNEVVGLAFSAAGDALAAAVMYEGVFLWDLPAGGPPKQLGTGCYFNTRVHFSADGSKVSWLAATPKTYCRDEGKLIDAQVPRGGHVIEMSHSPDGARMLTLHSMDEAALVCWSGHGAEWEQVWSVPAEKLTIHSAAASPTGKHVALLTRKTQPGRFWENPIHLEVRSAVNGLVVASGSYPYRYRGPLHFSPDGTQVVSSNDMTLLSWAVPQVGDPRLVRNDSRKHFTGLAYHPAGGHLFATSNDTTVHVFDAHTWDRTGRFTWKLGRLRSVAVSPDGALAAAGGDRGEVVVWDVDV